MAGRLRGPNEVNKRYIILIRRLCRTLTLERCSDGLIFSFDLALRVYVMAMSNTRKTQIHYTLETYSANICTHLQAMNSGLY